MQDTNLAPETWRDIPGFEGYYQVSDHGRVRSMDRVITRIDGRKCRYKGRVMKTHPDPKGYIKVLPTKGCKKYVFKVHRLVAQAFIPNPNNLPQVNHKDGDKANNHVSNLEWCDVHYNMKHAVENGLHTKGENHSRAKLTKQQVLEIREKYVPRKYPANRLAAEYNVSPHTVYQIIYRYSWRHI